MTTVCALLLHHKLNKTLTAAQNSYTLSTFKYFARQLKMYMFNVTAILSHYELHTTTPFTNALATTEF